MTLHYGSLFLDRWAEVKGTDMLDHWINELGSYNALTIGRALKALDSHPLPPSLPEFKALCKAFYEPLAVPRLEHVPASPEEAEAGLTQVRTIVESLTTKTTDYKKWAHEIVQLWDEGKYPWIAGYEIACGALGIMPKPRPARVVHRQPV